MRQYPYEGMHIVAVAASISVFLKKFFKFHFSGIGTHNTLKLCRNILVRTLRSLKIARVNSDCSHPLRSGVLREGRYAPFSNTSRPWLVVSPGRELFAPCGEKDPPTHACLLRNLPKKVVCAKTSTFQLRKMVTHLHAADAQPLAELAPRRMRLSCRLSVRALGESYDSLPLPKQRPAC